jgi:hypothetical protein
MIVKIPTELFRDPRPGETLNHEGGVDREFSTSEVISWDCNWSDTSHHREMFVNTGPEHMPEGEVAHRAYLKRLRAKGQRDES